MSKPKYDDPEVERWYRQWKAERHLRCPHEFGTDGTCVLCGIEQRKVSTERTDLWA